MKLFKWCNNNQGVVGIIGVMATLLTAGISIVVSRNVNKVSSEISDLSEKISPFEVDKRLINEYKQLKLKYDFELVDPKNEKEKVKIETLAQLEKYHNLGYYGNGTYNIKMESRFLVYLDYLDLINNSKNNTFKSAGTKFSDIILQLPAENLNKMISDKNSPGFPNQLSIKDFLKTKPHKISIEDDEVSILICIEDSAKIRLCKENEDESEKNSCCEPDSYWFLEIERADFTHSNREEILYEFWYQCSGSLGFTNLKAAYFNGKSWKNLNLEQKKIKKIFKIFEPYQSFDERF